MKFTKPACVTLLTLTLALGACSNADIRPASQAPRTYVSAHDTIDGECRSEVSQVGTGSNVKHYRNDGRFTVEDTLPMKGHFVRCATEQTTQPTENKPMHAEENSVNRSEPHYTVRDTHNGVRVDRNGNRY